MSAARGAMPDGAPGCRTANGLAGALGVGSGDIVALVGGGGKTTLLYRLTRELRESGVRAVAATTTKIRAPGDEDGVRLVCSASYEELAEAILDPAPIALVAGTELLPSGKVLGIPPEWCGRLVADGVAEALVVEADGAARKPVKTPEAWEPVVPGGTTAFVAVLGLSCFGKPAVAEVVFRLERFCEVTGISPGEPLGVEALKRLVRAPEGLLKGLPPGSRALAFLNQADWPGVTEAARELAREILAEPTPYERVVVGAAAHAGRPLEVWSRV